MYVQFSLIVAPPVETTNRQQTPKLKYNIIFSIFFLLKVFIFGYPEAQFPDAVPPLSIHSV